MNYSYLFIFIFGGAIGFFIAWLWKRKEIEPAGLEEKFKLIAVDVLRLNAEDFSKIAKKDMENVKGLMGVDLKNKEESFEKLVKTVNESVESVQKRVNQLENDRNQQMGAMTQGIKHILETGGKMLDTATDLKAALSSNSAIRGRWGETVLKNLLEESGLTEGEDFFVQEGISGEDGASLRPDIIIKFPGQLSLAVDSKASLDEFVKSIEEKDLDKKHQHLEGFVAQLKNRVKDLSSKEYQKHIDPKIPYVVMFIPGENAVRAAFEFDPDIYREAQGKKVMLASPATIMPLILLIAHAWRQYKSSQNAVQLNQEVADLGSRLKVFFDHVGDIGGSLSQATKKFNAVVGSWESRISPKIDQIKALGGSIEMGKDTIRLIEEEPRVSKKLSPPKKEKKDNIL